MSLSLPGWRRPGAVVVVFAALVAFSAWYAPLHFTRQLERELDAHLVDALIDARASQVSLVEGWDYLAARVDEDLARILPQSSPGPIRKCRARVLRMQQQRFAGAAGERVLVLARDTGAASLELALAVSCQRNWAYILVSQGLVVLAGLALFATIPGPLGPRQREWMKRFAAGGCPRRRARAMSTRLESFSPAQVSVLESLLQDDGAGEATPPFEAFSFAAREKVAALGPDQLAWFRQALALYPGDWERALMVARAAPQLEFLPATRSVWIHGIESRLPSTPFFYYQWYAARRFVGEGEGWFLNPPSNRPDHEHAAGLIALMQAESGHARAINELRDKGLRAKVLDQNRSKVKDHLTALLGEELAAGYLFEDSRDTRTGRSRYRLALPPSRIRTI